MRTQYWLYLILIFAFGVRIAGIGYGLPLWLVGDEPPFTTAALKMLELRTILPTLHMEAFKSTLYFPPYLSYLYLLPFSVLIAIKYILFSGGFTEFKNYLISDLSGFFIIARSFSAVFGTITVYLIYRIAKNIFREERPALLSAAFLATSLLHVYLSTVARDWVLAVLMFTLVIFTLSHPDLSFRKRYLIGATLSGLAFGVSLIAGFPMIFMLLFYLFYERHSVIDVFKEKTLYAALFIFLALAGTSIAIYPYGFHFSSDNSIKVAKSFTSFLDSLVNFLRSDLISEPVLLGGAALGLGIAYFRRRDFFYVATLFIFTFATIFYWLYHYEHRYTIYLFPLLTILAGYGFSVALEKLNSKRLRVFFISLILLLPLTSTLNFDLLFFKNDSRIMARHYIENNLPTGTKVLVFAEMTRLASTATAIHEQASLDPSSLRQIDHAEASLAAPRAESFHALNLYSVKNDNFYEHIADYARQNHYEYLLIDPYFSGFGDLRPLLSHSMLLATFGEHGGEEIPRDGHFGYFTNLFTMKEFGPRIEIYKL
jgi:hypothetical protein